MFIPFSYLILFSLEQKNFNFKNYFKKNWLYSFLLLRKIFKLEVSIIGKRKILALSYCGDGEGWPWSGEILAC
jgi:hypothetical protein